MRKVSYVSDRIESNKGSHYDLMSTKYFGWKHEQEYRIIVPLSSASPKEIKKGKGSFSYIYLDNNIMPALSRVVLGVNNSLDEYDTERKVNESLIGSAPVKFPIRVVRASLEPSTFCISPNLNKIHQHAPTLWTDIFRKVPLFSPRPLAAGFFIAPFLALDIIEKCAIFTTRMKKY